MDPIGDEVQNALSLIDGAGLPYPSGPFLESFITEALNPVLAARYMKGRLAAGEGSSLVSDWSYIIDSITQKGSVPPPPNPAERIAIIKRDGNRCCITGKPGSFLDPLIVTPILPVPSGWITDRDGIKDMLGAFFGPPYRDWWLSYVKDPNYTLPSSNLWLVRRSAAVTFAHGLVKLDRRQPSMIEYELRHVLIKPDDPIEVNGMYPLLGDHSRQGTGKVDARFIGSHARLCTSIQFLDISRALSSNIPHTSTAAGYLSKTLLPCMAIFRFFSTALFTAWRMVPNRTRFAAYGMLNKLGRLVYGQEHSTVQRLPFGLYLKFHAESAEPYNEFNALRVVRQYSTIPTPSPLDVVSGPRGGGSFSSGAYLLTTRVPGLPLSRCLYVLSDADRDQIAAQLKDYVAQLRGIPSSPNLNAPISNTLGEACRDTRIRGATPIGPFADETAFSQLLRYSDEPARRGHKIFFSHADLNPRNILVDRVAWPDGSCGWAVSGIVDWESAGHYPEYWEYTKAMFEGFRWPRRHNDLIQSVFSEFGDYSRELDVERRSWEAGDAV
ncbi:hypothetical protein B0H67DRAFT_648928 [Lasiosphaeris hirsuta]|uniref:Aminoglycoside phosphotransferase domain-containing protein n=1 Tax=Lasiosphaeris hirsuta TaxID=260670 RepID=A0AA39ZVP3_9PEZI|nr:hypothetical protein B0H67DRAFT_648928 [Lasiosphaeris hirsuta]